MTSDLQKLLATIDSFTTPQIPPLGEWTSVTSTAVERVLLNIFADSGGARAINPQPLPPRVAFASYFAQAVIDRAELMREIAEGVSGEASHGVVVVRAYFDRFVNVFTSDPSPLEWPMPSPTPAWFQSELGASELIGIAARFAGAAKRSASQEITSLLSHAADEFLQAGLGSL